MSYKPIDYNLNKPTNKRKRLRTLSIILGVIFAISLILNIYFFVEINNKNNLMNKAINENSSVNTELKKVKTDFKNQANKLNTLNEEITKLKKRNKSLNYQLQNCKSKKNSSNE